MFKPALEGRKDYKELQHEIDGLNGVIGGLNKQINDEKRPDELKKLRQQLLKREGERTAVQDILNRARRAAERIHAYEDIGPVVADIGLPNGLVLYHVNFLSPPKWTGDQ